MAQNSIHILLVEDDNLAVELFISHAAKISNGDIWEVDHVGLMADVKALDAYDIVILDLYLPDSTKEETIEWLRRTAPRIPIVVCSGTEDSKTIDDCLEAGAVGFLMKSALNEQLISSTIRTAMKLSNREELTKRLKVYKEACDHYGFN